MSDYLYHVTLLRNLDSIAQRGLVAGQSQNWPGYSSHARGRVFLTEADAVSGWVHKVTYSAGMDSDNQVQEGYIPVVLRTPLEQVQELLRPDEIGSRDVLDGDSFYIEDTLAPEELEVYTPEGWIYVDEVDPDDLQEYAYDNADKEMEEDEDTGLEEELVWLDEHVFNPFRHDASVRTGWGETVNTVLVHTCGRNSIEPECEGAEGFEIMPVGKLPKTKKSKKGKK